MLPMRGGRDRIRCIVEMLGEADVVRGNAEQQLATNQEENSTREDPVKNAAEQRNLGTLANKIKCKWKKIW